MAKNDCYRINHLENNLRRWHKLADTDIYPADNTFYCLLLIYQNLCKANKNKQEDVNKMIMCIQNFSMNTQNKQQLVDLMNLLIRNKMYGNIDKLRNILDIKSFLKPNKRLTDALINKTRSIKLDKYLTELDK